MSQKQLKKVFITGIEGSGKTTLAQVVYNQIKPQFHCGAFLRAPRNVCNVDYDSDNSRSGDRDTSNVEGHLKRLFYWEMLCQLDVENDMNISEISLDHWMPANDVKRFLQNKRYLLVIDDIWDSNQLDWLLQVLPNNVYGSRIISIIHIDKMIQFRSSLLDESVYKIKSLGYLDSRKLFLKQLLVPLVSEASCPNAPTDVLNEILKMCGGWPSVIVSISLVLATRVTATKPWEEMLNSVYSAWKQMTSFEDFESDHSLDFEELIQILLLPYSHLPSTLKNCLLYLNVHARNQTIHRTTMVRKWIAAGFFSENVGYNRAELASRYFDELIDRNFIQLVEYGIYPGEEIYKVNYIMHNVLRWLSQKGNFATVVSDGGTISEYAESICLSIQCSGSELSVYTSKMKHNICSITIVGPAKFYVDCNMEDLRVLDLDGCKDLDNSAMYYICRMTGLRYLSLKHTQVTEIPPAIGALQVYLGTLDISQSKIRDLPPEIGNLEKLKTLDASRTQISSLPREIAELQNLETLDISRTQISSLPRGIAKLQNLESLDISQSKISNLPPEIWELHKLKILDASGTQICSVPEEIAELRNLETLDVRQTQVEELPRELFELPNLAHLYFGQSDFPRGVEMPMGSDQWKPVKVVGTVDSREWLESAMEEVSGLTGVRELEVVLHDQPADKAQNDKLLSSIAMYKNLDCLIIYGDYNPSDDFIPVSPYFVLLQMLKVAGRFVKVPRWIAHLSTLKKLDVRVCKLDQDDQKILGGLPGLSNLALALVCIPWKKKVAITGSLHSRTCTDLPPLEETSPAGFMSLEVFSFDCRVPWITFEQGAMPRLKKLHLTLYASPADKFPSGIINLHSLEKIILRYSSEYASCGGVRKVVAAMREEASSHRNLIDLSVNDYYEEFLPNTGVDETITGTEIEEASNHGNPIELPVDGDHEVLLSNARIEKTLTGTEIEECY